MIRVAPNQIITITAVATIIFLLSVLYDVRLAFRGVPDGFQYIIPNQPAYFVTGPLGDLWENGGTHVSQLFQPSASRLAKQATKSIDELFATRCLTRDVLKELPSIGIDQSRGLSATIAPSLPWLFAALLPIDYWKYGSFAAVIPIEDYSKFESFVKKLGVRPIRIFPLPPDSRGGKDDGEKTVEGIHLDPVQAKNVSVCSSQDPAPRPLGAESAPPVSIKIKKAGKEERSELYLIPSVDAPAAILASCTVDYSDGSTRSCACEPSCPDRQLTEMPPSRSVSALIAGRMVDGVLLPSGHFLFYLPNIHVALIATSPELGSAALNEDENRSFFQNDDSFREIGDYLSTGRGRRSGVIFGGVNVPYSPVAGKSHFELQFEPARLTARLVIPWQTSGAEALAAFIRPNPFRSSGERPLSQSAELRISDPELGRYIRGSMYASSDALQKAGTFRSFFEELSKLDKAGPLRVGFLGVRGGVPEFVMSLQISSEQAERLVLRQQIRNRESRDKQVLAAAAREYMRRYGKFPEDVAAVVSLLQPEPGAVWMRYDIVDDSSEAGIPVSSEKNARKKGFRLTQPGLSSSDFQSALFTRSQYRGIVQFIPPPVTDNDFLYRSEPIWETKKGRNRLMTLVRGREAETLLRNGRYRMVAYMDAPNGRLLLATDIDALGQVLNAERRPADLLDVSDNPKIEIHGDPSFVIANGRIFPDKEVSEFFEANFLDLLHYSRMAVTVTPENGRAVTATVVLGYE